MRRRMPSVWWNQMQFSRPCRCPKTYRAGRIVGQRQPMRRSLRAFCKLSLEIRPLERRVEALLDAARVLRLHVVGPCSSYILAYHARCSSAESEEVYIYISCVAPRSDVAVGRAASDKAPASTPFSWPLIPRMQPPRSTPIVLRGGQLFISGQTILYLGRTDRPCIDTRLLVPTGRCHRAASVRMLELEARQ